ncbi:eCIS core domain-containing protein [Tenacibaculum sp.]|uniref:eCIS core domain-containing protein n=1 Tax=Tenacibaculum sp. TaxID=1906242 RepID=UPI003AA95948
MFKRDKKPEPTATENDQKKNLFFQPKLAFGRQGDSYEVEADKMADKVVGNTHESNAIQQKEEESEVQQKSLATEISPLIQKAEALEEEPVQKQEEEAVQSKEEEEPIQKQEEAAAVQSKEEEEPVQKQEEAAAVQSKEEEESIQKQEEEETVQSKTENKGATPNKSSFENKLRGANGGQKMDAGTLTEMESGFGADFSHVNIHNDSEAAQMSQEIGAQAFTHGNDIYFNEGKYNPNSKGGKHLLAHELTHTIQQKGMVQKKIQRKKQPKSSRFKHDENISKALNNSKYIKLGSTGIQVITLQKALLDAGYTLTSGVSGTFDKGTDLAVRKYQKDNKLQVDGIVGPETMGHLDNNFAATTITNRYTNWYKKQRKLYKSEASFPFHVKIMNFFYKSRNFHVIQMLKDKGYTIKIFTSAYDFWKDIKTGKITKSNLSKRLRGNTEKHTNTIRLNANLSIEDAAMTLYHELHHAYSKETDYLKQEIEVRILTEQFAIDNNLPETGKNYRTKSNEVNKKYIENQIMSSSHYNPKGRVRVKRTYGGEKIVGPWIVPK